MKVFSFLLVATTFYVRNSIAQQIEHTDTTIAKIVYPQQDLKLWYGNDAFRVDDFVILPNYTILHSRETSTIRLLDNRNMFVLDNVKLLSIKTIQPHNVDDEKVAIGPIIPWFSIANDSTVLAGTASFKGRKNVSGYVELAIRGNKLFVKHEPFPIEKEVDSGDMSSFKTQFINSYIDYKGNKLMASWMSLKPELKGKITPDHAVVYRKTDDLLSIIYETPEHLIAMTNPGKQHFNMIQLLSIDTKLLIYDPEREELLTATNDLSNLTLIDVAKALPVDMPTGRKFGKQFLFDRVANQLYYRVTTLVKDTRDQVYLKANLSNTSLTFEPILRVTIADYYGYYVNNRRLFFYDKVRGYIYATKQELP